LASDLSKELRVSLGARELNEWQSVKEGFGVTDAYCEVLKDSSVYG